MDAIHIGIAVVEGHAQLGVVDQLGDGVPLVHRVAHLQVGHLPQVAGVGRLNVELRDLLIDRLQLLVAVVHHLLGGRLGLPGCGVIHPVELLSRRDLVALLDKELQNGTGTGGDGGGILGLGGSAALHVDLNGPQLDRLYDGVSFGVTLPEHKVPQRKSPGYNHGHGNQQAYYHSYLASPFFLSGTRRRGLGLNRLFQHRHLLIRHRKFLLIHVLGHCHSSIPDKVSNDKAVTNS